MDFSNIEVTIDHIANAGNKIKVYATVTFDGMFKVHGVRLAESKQGLNIFMPQKAFNKNGKTLYTPTRSCPTKNGQWLGFLQTKASPAHLRKSVQNSCG